MIIRKLSALVGLAIGSVLMPALLAQAAVPLLQVSPTQLSFSAVSEGNAPPGQSVALLSNGQATVSFAVQITGSGPGDPVPAWLTVEQSSGTAPSGLIVSVNQTGLAASPTPYTAAIQISVPDNITQNPIIISVGLTVSNAAPRLLVTPSFLRFGARIQTEETLEQSIAVDNSGGEGLLSFKASIVGQSPWISEVTPSHGKIVPNSPALLRIYVSTRGLAVGSYHEVIQITSSAGSINVPVSLFISDQGAILGLNVTGLRIPVRQGSSSSIPRRIAIQNLGDPGSSVTWTADLLYGSDWLTLGSSNGIASAISPGTLSLSPKPRGSAASLPVSGSYALVRVSDPQALNSPQYLVAVLDVESASTPPHPEVFPAGLVFTTSAGAPAAQTVSVSTSSTTPVAFQVSTTTSDGASWLTANVTDSAASAQSPGKVNVSVKSTFLLSGIYTGGVNIAMGGVLQTVNVTFVVVQSSCIPYALALTPTGLTNNFAVLAGWPATLSVQVNDNCGNPVRNASAAASFSNGDPPLLFRGDRQTSTYSATWQPGAASPVMVTIRATAPCCGPITAQVIGAINHNAAPSPRLAPNGVLHIFLNAADPALLGAGLAPGNMAQVYGAGLALTSTGTTVPLPHQFKGTFMLVGDLNAPLFYISDPHINVQIPSELAPTRQYSAVVSSNGAFTLPETIDIVPLQPGMATWADGSVIAQHSDYSLVTASSPAKPAEPLIIYLAGMGPTSPSVASGSQTPSRLVPVLVQPTVAVDGQDADIGYAGLTPGEVGLYQINFTVPAKTRSGNVKLAVTQGRVKNTTTLPVAATISAQPITLTPNPLNLTDAKGTLTVTLPAPAGTVGQIVDLANTDAFIAAVPKNVVIAPGATSASVTVTPGDTSGSAVVTALAPGFASGATTVNVVAPGQASITATSGTGQSAAINTAFSSPLVATVKDASGSPLSGVTVTFTAPASGVGGAFSGGVNTATTNALGVATSATFTANGTLGAYKVTASAAGTSATASFFLTNTAAGQASITVTSGTGQSAAVNTAFSSPLVATVKDASGNPMNGVTVTFTAPASGAGGAFAGGVNTATTNTLGVATSAIFNANGTLGAYTVTASAAGASTTPSFSLTNTAAGQASITATSGTGQSAAVNTAFSSPLVATVKDASGNPMNGVIVTFTAPSSGAGGAFAGGVNTATTNALGVATSVAFTANGNPGAYTVTASEAGISATASFFLTNTAAGQASITATSGTGQSAPINTAFSSPLVATVKDASGNPMNGVTVTFTAPSSGAGGAFAGGINTATTNTLGVATSVAFTANGTLGPYTVTATIPGATTGASFLLTNIFGATAGSLTVTVPSAVGQNLQATGTVRVLLAAPAGGISVTLTSGDAAKLLLAGGPTNSGSVSITSLIPQGSTSVDFYVHGAANSGTTVVTASAANLSSGTATVTLAPSGFVLAGPGGFSPPSFSTSPGVKTALTVSAALFDSSRQYVQNQAVAGGVTVSVSVTSSAPAVGTITGSPLTFTGGQATATVQFNAVSAGSTTLATAVPTGFSAPSQYTSVTATVGVSGLTTAPVTVGRNLETPAGITLNAVATSIVPITLTSNNPSQLLLAASAADPGSSSIVVNVQPTFQSIQFFVYGLASSGSATYSASAPGFGATSGTVNLAPSGVVITGPNAQYPSFITAVSQGNQPITVYTALLGSSSDFVQPMALAGGLSVNITVSSSNPSVGTITTSPLTITGGNYSATTQFSSAGVGGSTLTASTPAGFSTPAPATNQRPGPTVTANVTAPAFSLLDDGILGKNLAGPGSVGVAQAAPAGGVVVTLTSNDSNLLLSTTGRDRGFQSITVTIPGGGTTATYYLYALASSGAGTYTASGPGYGNRTNTITYAPSGVLAEGPFAIGGQQYVSASVSVGPTDVFVSTGVLDSAGNLLGHRPLAGLASVTVSLTSSTPSVGTIIPSVTIPAGSGSANAKFTPLAVGRTTISVSTPTGYANPVSNNIIAVVTQ